MADVTSLMGAIRDVGKDPHAPGYQRQGFSHTELTLREWFIAECESRGFDVEVDANGITWAWVTQPGPNAVVTGSHLDSVPGGGEFDGPLGVASALAAVDVLKEEGRLPERRLPEGTHNPPTRPLAIAVFPEEEGSRFGVACLGSRLLTGAIDATTALNLTDADGTTFAEVATSLNLDPNRIGTDRERLSRIGSFIELHVEQGLGLANTAHPVAIGGSIVGHGRFRLTFTGQGNHAGTTPMHVRADPVVAASQLIGAIPALTRAVDSRAVATVGRTRIHPGGTNVIASRMDVYVDIRHPEDAVVQAVLAAIGDHARHIVGSGSPQPEVSPPPSPRPPGQPHGSQPPSVHVELAQESYSPTTHFHSDLNARLRSVLPQVPVLDSGAGHDAGILAGFVPAAMVFVRNPTGVSHAPEEACEVADQRAGVRALADVLAMELGATQ